MNLILSKNKNQLIAISLICGFYLVILIRTAWIGDDAAITLRTTLNFINGFGPTFNIDERVQAYTHPLWFLLISFFSFITGHVFYTTFYLSIFLSLLTIATLLLKASKENATILLVGISIIFSKAFVDYSTSGLENPLSHILLIAAFIVASHAEQSKKALQLFLIICSFIYLNRPDLLLITLPLTLHLIAFHRNTPVTLLKSITFAAIPLLLWLIFSLTYYGFPFPNTAYAKLGTGIALDERALQGLKYLLHTLFTDPLTLFIISVGLIVGAFGHRHSRYIALGILLYIAYVIYIGGDFMEGRFFTAIFVTSLLIIINEIQKKKILIPLSIIAFILGINSFYPNIASGPYYAKKLITADGIADERGYYFQATGLITAEPQTFAPRIWSLSTPKTGTICGLLGYSSIIKGPSMHYIDTCALADPLLSRLPAKENTNWRIGHFYRQLPTNYIESVAQDKNLLSDPSTREYYDAIRTITRGPLFSRKRIEAILQVNLNQLQKPNWSMYRYSDIPLSNPHS